MHLIFFNMQSLIFSSVKTWITSCAIKEVFRTQCIILSKTSWLFVLFIKSFIPIEWTAIVLLNSLFFASGHAQHDKVKLRVSAELVFFFFFFLSITISLNRSAINVPVVLAVASQIWLVLMKNMLYISLCGCSFVFFIGIAPNQSFAFSFFSVVSGKCKDYLRIHMPSCLLFFFLLLLLMIE
jgi:hypothetical protein